jgi:predicted phosphodiesterase
MSTSKTLEVADKTVSDTRIVGDTWCFVCDSDLHYGTDDDKPRPEKGNRTQLLTELKKTHDIDLMLCPGDLTNRGADGHPTGCKGDPNANQLEALISQCVKPIEALGVSVKLCPGNHDINRSDYWRLSVLKYVCDRHDATYSWFSPETSSCYTFMHKGLQFICMGIYPKNISWLKAHLPKNKKQPIVFYYHYNTRKGQPYSDWWSDKEKDTFFDTIYGYNVQAIINGHLHTTQISDIQNIKYILCADDMVLFEVTKGVITKIQIINP